MGEPSKTDSPIDLTGRTLGDFQVLRRLGQGGMGQVYLAEQVSLKRKVALKLLRPELSDNAVSLQRFKSEAESIARATHANIVQVYAIGEDHGLHYMALEFVEGRNLREFLEKKGPPELLLGLNIMRQVAAALQRASELGIIHRDIKPENILLTAKGEVKVADFGLCPVLDESGQPLHLTQADTTMGTPLYMSPEQVERRTIDHRTDIYSFGVTCYHMFAGQPPFRGNSPFEVAVQHVQKEPQPLSEIRPDLPLELCAIVHKMMAKRPEDRYQTGREIVRDVARLRDTVVGLTLNSGVSLFDSASSISNSAPAQAVPRGIRMPSRTLIAVTIALALMGGFAFGWWRNQAATHTTGSDDGNASADVSAKTKERQAAEEKRMRQKVMDHAGGNLRDLKDGLKAAIDLTALYLQQRRLEEAEAFCKDLTVGSQPLAYQQLGKLGTALVLAFRDEAAKSNEQFLAIMEGDRSEKGTPALQLLVKSSPVLREWIAEALLRNRTNSPESFPKTLEQYLAPPLATLK